MEEGDREDMDALGSRFSEVQAATSELKRKQVTRLLPPPFPRCTPPPFTHFSPLAINIHPWPFSLEEISPEQGAMVPFWEEQTSVILSGGS